MYIFVCIYEHHSQKICTFSHEDLKYLKEKICRDASDFFAAFSNDLNPAYNYSKCYFHMTLPLLPLRWLVARPFGQLVGRSVIIFYKGRKFKAPIGAFVGS